MFHHLLNKLPMPKVTLIPVKNTRPAEMEFVKERAELSGLSHTTLANVFKRNTVPSISTLQAICKGFGITLSQFFAKGEMVEMTPELKELFDGWVNLNPEQKAAVQQMINAMNNSK